MLTVCPHSSLRLLCQAELDAANPRREQWSADALSGLQYLNCVIKETLRLWPVAALGAGRVSLNDVTVGDVVIPKGSEVLMPFFAIQRYAWCCIDLLEPESAWGKPNTDSDMP